MSSPHSEKSIAPQTGRSLRKVIKAGMFEGWYPVWEFGFSPKAAFLA